MRCILTNRFLKDYRALDPKVQEKVDLAIETIAENRFYPGLKTKKVQGVARHWKNKIWEARVNGSFRITYHIEENELILRRCGTHQIYSKP